MDSLMRHRSRSFLCNQLQFFLAIVLPQHFLPDPVYHPSPGPFRPEPADATSYLAAIQTYGQTSVALNSTTTRRSARPEYDRPPQKITPHPEPCAHSSPCSAERIR